MTESDESSDEESSDEAFESDNEVEEEKKEEEEKEEEEEKKKNETTKSSPPKSRPPPIPKAKLAKVSSKKQLSLQKIPSSKSLEETTEETSVGETTSRSRGRAVEAVYGVTDGPCPGLYRTKKEAQEKNPDSEIKSFGSYQDARESITTSLLEDKEEDKAKVKMSPRT